MRNEKNSDGVSKIQHSRLNVSVHLKGNIYGHYRITISPNAKKCQSNRFGTNCWTCWVVISFCGSKIDGVMKNSQFVFWSHKCGGQTVAEIPLGVYDIWGYLTAHRMLELQRVILKLTWKVKHDVGMICPKYCGHGPILSWIMRKILIVESRSSKFWFS